MIKKIAIATIMTFGIFTMVSADIGVKLGVSAQIGSMEASGSETNSTTGLTETSETKEALFGTAGFFIEKDLAFLPGRAGEIGSRISFGYDNIAHNLDLGTADNARLASLGAAGAVVPATVHKLDAEITDFQTIYAMLNLTDWLYVKVGEVTVDVTTKFTGSSTSSYTTGHELDGTMYGIGIAKSIDNGLFFRLEYNDYDIDGKTVTNSGTDSVFSATLKDVSGSTGRISIGKAF